MESRGGKKEDQRRRKGQMLSQAHLGDIGGITYMVKMSFSGSMLICWAVRGLGGGCFTIVLHMVFPGITTNYQDGKAIVLYIPFSFRF